jgi:hypothetical protein
MFYTIYKTTNTLTGKIYIGKHQTRDLKDGYMGSGKHLNRAINKYGIENFRKEILFQFDNELDMNIKEAELVTEEFCLREDTYNLCVGGQGGFSYINRNKLTNTKESLKKRHQNKTWLESVSKNRMSNSVRTKRLLEKYPNGTTGFLGKVHTDEWRKNHSEVMKEKQSGLSNSQHGTMWITNGQENKKIKKEVDTIPKGWYKGRKIPSVSDPAAH